MSHQVGYVSVLCAAVQSTLRFPLIVAAIGDAARAYSSNPGAQTSLDNIKQACTFTTKGKARTPAVGTLPACILASVTRIAQYAVDGPARLAPRGKDEDKEAYESRKASTLTARRDASQAFAESECTAFEAEVAAGQRAREDKRAEDKRAAAADAVKVAPATDADGAPLMPPAPTVNAAAELIELRATLAAAEISLRETIADRDAIALKLGEVTAQRNAAQEACHAAQEDARAARAALETRTLLEGASKGSNGRKARTSAPVTTEVAPAH